MSNDPTLVGMLHLPALPGAPRSTWPMARIEERLVAEAKLLAAAGFDAAVIENFGDVPFERDAVEPVTVASMTRLACAVRREAPGLVLGVNVLRNDASAALAVALAAEASFIRVNVHVGATATDQGIIEGAAAATTRLRARLDAKLAIWADVHVKHGRNLSHGSIEAEAEDAVERGLADALIVSGTGTGKTTSLDDVRRVKALGLERDSRPVRVYVGSGVATDTVRDVLAVADGVIVGSALKEAGRASNAIDPRRLEDFVARARG